MHSLADDMSTALPTDFSVDGSIGSELYSPTSDTQKTSGFVLQLNIDKYNNYTNEDVHELTNEILVTAGLFAERKGVVFA